MRKGLTLMELLTVISILATLAALMFPIYINLRTRTDITICADQLRQIGIALKMYARDYGDDTPYGMPFYWGLLYPNYIRNRDILICPTFRKIGTPVVEALNNLFQQHPAYKIYGGTWVSYFSVLPRSLDESAKNPSSSIWISFSEIYAKRADNIPVGFCYVHKYGCPESNLDFYYIAKIYSLNCHAAANPSAPILILRWSGTVNAVYRDRADILVMLIDY
ncbi:type II secretion system protein [Fervidibacter sacchari]|uniref:Prepilin-type N-terminal cleavage/methylation domain-containing protein n=1 Tax=Candidatus Fervidibacter sacchari TaxID=1448929 RepID=A0ABT2EMV2_9BACT|nr:type II secretion system protein [Candidatus Fervidibacter sacchari]MCS3918761.1 prepilin-type N-terminal cleavage/methylation domain-containing protein [Candidatus Fervidibacter sacchari]WKU17490.1 type II secretion system protein [Candidatus Fervidibacter sacchari]